MGPEERDAIYDTEIAPELARLAKRCQDVGMSLVAFVEWHPPEAAGGRTVSLTEDASFAIRLVELAMQCLGNVDSFMIALMRHARTHGHNSMVLAMLEAKMTTDQHIALGEKLTTMHDRPTSGDTHA